MTFLIVMYYDINLMNSDILYSDVFRKNLMDYDIPYYDGLLFN